MTKATQFVLGIDVGGSGIKGAPVDILSGELLAKRHRIPTPQPASPDQVAATVFELVQHFNWNGLIGCGFPAVVQHGVAKTASNIDNSWIGTNVEVVLSQATGCKVRVLNDADAAGMAEMKFGAGKDQKGVVIMVTVGTGIGTAIFSNGQLLPNTEMGHIQLHGMNAEKYASDATRKRLKLTREEWAYRFNIYLKEIEKLFWPDLFIVGGGTSKKFNLFSEVLTIKTPIVPAMLLNQAGTVGAALHAYYD